MAPSNVNSSNIVPIEKIIVEENDNNKNGKYIQYKEKKNCYNFLSLNWVYPLFKKGSERQLEQKDLPITFDIGDIASNYEIIKRYVGDSRRWGFCSFTYCVLCRYGGLKYLSLHLLEIINIIFDIGYVIIIQMLLEIIEGSTEDDNIWIYLIILFVLPLIQATVQSALYQFRHTLRLELTGALKSLVYQKAMQLSNDDKSRFEIGKLVNNNQGDVRDSINFMMILPEIYKTLTPVATMALLAGNLGNRSVYSLGWVVALSGIPFYPLLFMLNLSINEYNGRKDKRITWFSEILRSIRIIKFYNWEEPMAKETRKIRKLEYNSLRKFNVVNLLMGILFAGFVNQYVKVEMFLVSAIECGRAILPSTGFTSLAFLKLFIDSLRIFPFLILSAVNGRIAIQRLSKLLATKSRDKKIYNEMIKGKPVIEIRKGSFSWGTTDQTTTLHKVTLPAGVTVGKTIEYPLTDGRKIEVLVEEGQKEGDIVTVPITHGFKLQNINVTVDEGEFVAIIGLVGCGKTSLLMSILQETNYQNESPDSIYSVRGSISYASQDPWVFNATIKNNILFGSKYNKEKYEHVIDLACLRPDLEVIEGGDLAEIGERGINLSGGQKARVALARAIYKNNRDLYLFDGILSAVDAEVGQHIFQNCFLEYLKDKTKILVTHSSQYLQHFDKIVIMDEGTIQHVGTFDELKEEGVNFNIFDEEDENVNKKGNVEKTNRANDENDNNNISLLNEKKRSNPKLIEKKESTYDLIANEMESDKEVKVIKKEKVKGDTVDNSVYWFLFKNSGKGFITFALLFMTIHLFLEHMGMNLVLVDWGTHNLATCRKQGGKKPFDNLNIGQLNPDNEICWERCIQSECTEECQKKKDIDNIQKYYNTTNAVKVCGDRIDNTTTRCYIADWVNTTKADMKLHKNSASLYFSAFVVFAISTALYQIFVKVVISLRLSRQFHRKMLKSVLAAKMRFFDTTTMGTSINRFQNDLPYIDFGQSVNGITHYYGLVLVICFIVLYMVITTSGIGILLAIPIIYALYYINKLYQKLMIQLNRFIEITKSPLISSFTEDMHGVRSIRAYGFFDQFNHRNDMRLTSFINVQYCIELTQFYTLLRLNIITNNIMGLIAFFVIIAKGSVLEIEPNSASFVFYTCITLRECIMYFIIHIVRYHQSYMNHVDRIKEYCELEGEDYKGSSGNIREVATKEWPMHGKIIISKLSIRYATDLPLILKDLSLTIDAGQSIGVCGRTGSGKSTLMLSLLRILTYEAGSILIDDIDIAKLPLNTLRSNIAIIPQDPVLFTLNVRKNLDPFDQSSDEEIWNALKQCRLYKKINSMENGIMSMVKLGGENFSAGEKQLVCIARAILRKPRILLLDEATSKLDEESDKAVQMVFRTSFKNCTTLTIAHRINTIIDSDKILLLNNGQIDEYDEPKKLLENKESSFYQLAKEDGCV